jgi:hypothetical protein
MSERRSKYNARRSPCDLGGVPHTHDSLRERQRHWVLAYREQLGEIGDLRVHSRWPLVVAGIKVADYESDYDYWELATARTVLEDVKSPGTRTAVYRLKRKLVEVLYPQVDFREVD